MTARFSLLVVGFAVTVSLVFRTWGFASPVVPRTEVGLNFSHAAHLARGAACHDCHAEVRASHSALDRLIPGEEHCRRCHAETRSAPDAPTARSTDETRCELCHPVGAAKAAWAPVPQLKFSHAAHQQVDCLACHAAISGQRDAAQSALPTMAVCAGCHPTAQAVSVVGTTAGCRQCHLSGAGARLVTALPTADLIPVTNAFGDAHGEDFLRHHAVPARMRNNTCGACHAESTCTDCHRGEIRPAIIHPGDFALNHGMQARREASTCSQCHRAQTFCIGCHERTGVGLRVNSDFQSEGDLGRFHPPGWTDGSNSHGVAAKRNLNSCVSCHREESCLGCHSGDSASRGISPHPPGWAESRRCNAMLATNQRMCLRCHVDAAPSCSPR